MGIWERIPNAATIFQVFKNKAFQPYFGLNFCLKTCFHMTVKCVDALQGLRKTHILSKFLLKRVLMRSQELRLRQSVSTCSPLLRYCNHLI